MVHQIDGCFAQFFGFAAELFGSRLVVGHDAIMPQVKALFGVVWVGWIVTVSGYAAEVALLVHHLAVFVGGFVGVQVDRLLADRAGELLFVETVGCHIRLISPYAGKFITNAIYRTWKCSIADSAILYRQRAL
jgi:hypothetical protein